MLGAGTTFAGYRIEGVLGQGGMGTVYLARHPRLPRTVALKLLNREVTTDPELVRRFEREADVVAQLEHPGIVGVLDRGANDGHLWIAMQYIRGTDAASWDAARQPPATVTRLLSETALALDYAHSRGILHRDVKPANIVIAHGDGFRDSHAVLTDFGIAGLIDSTDTKITATGTFTATLAYASPEQLSGEVVDPRSDQYSLACTLFALLAGRPPYAATNPGQVVMGHISKPVPRLTTLRPDLPAALDTVLERAMAKHRDDRFPTCIAFITAAHDALESQPVADTVNIARMAPTVHNSSPIGTGQTAEPTHQLSPAHPRPGWAPTLSLPDPIPHAPTAPYPAQDDPIGHHGPGPRRRFPVVPVVVAGLVVVLVGVGMAALSLSGSEGGESPSTPAWGAHQYIRDDFPGLVPERDMLRGWKQASCYTGKNARGYEIKCNHFDNSGISFTIEDHSTLSAVEERLDSYEFVYSEPVQGPDIVHSAETKSAPHSRLGTPAQVTVPPPNSAASVFAAAYFSFPADPVRGRYLITVKWPGHTADDILRDWWAQAPLSH
ncbi:serine/threonine-protein kinase [Nocardia fusca]|uniref:serine/threonine-protein kinase n=1 Tax=Nocardia fusca TaxID=941183 RepID=UPI0007A7533C|nr:serine/threonine-protein kinase [Nocardia fusca]